MCGLSYGWLFGCMVEVKRITQPFDTFMVKFLQHAFFFSNHMDLCYVALLDTVGCFHGCLPRRVHEVANFRDAAGPVWKPSKLRQLRRCKLCML